LIGKGENLKREGRRYIHEQHDSLVFTDNAYFWNSRQESGNAVDFLTRHRGMTFLKAVDELTGFTPPTDGEAEEDSVIQYGNKADCKRAIAYLHKTRGISYTVIESLIKQGLLQQQKQTNNVIFPMMDENGERVGAELQGTLSDKRYKGIEKGSKYGYGFNVRFSEKSNFDFVLFFESAVDLLSFWDITTQTEGKTLENCLLVSMAGLKVPTIKHTIQAFKGRLRMVICIDDDLPAQEFIKALDTLKTPYKVRRPDGGFKDWNEQLKGGAYERHR
jgi:hypothetical protein